MEECSCNHCCSEKSGTIPYSQHVFVALGTQHAIGMCHFVICVLSDSTIFFYLILWRAQFKKKVIERKMCVLIFCTIFSETYLILRGTERDMIKKCVLVSMLRIRYSCHILKNLEVCWQIFEKYANIKFHEQPSRGNIFASCGLTDCQTDMTNLIVTFRNFANPPKKK